MYFSQFVLLLCFSVKYSIADNEQITSKLDNVESAAELFELLLKTDSASGLCESEVIETLFSDDNSTLDPNSSILGDQANLRNLCKRSVSGNEPTDTTLYKVANPMIMGRAETPVTVPQFQKRIIQTLGNWNITLKDKEMMDRILRSEPKRSGCRARPVVVPLPYPEYYQIQYPTHAPTKICSGGCTGAVHCFPTAKKNVTRPALIMETTGGKITNVIVKKYAIEFHTKCSCSCMVLKCSHYEPNKCECLSTPAVP